MLMHFQVMAVPISRGSNILDFLAIYHANILFNPINPPGLKYMVTMQTTCPTSPKVTHRESS